MEEIIIGNKYKLLNQIGEGSFGKIFEAEHIITNDRVAVKIEKKDVKSILKHEANIYYKCKSIKGIPSIRMFGTESNYNYIVMDLLDLSLEQLRENDINGRISLIETLSISIQMINCLEKLHGLGIIHRDLKPENILMRENTVYLIDFGIARYYINQDRCHIPITYDKKFIGNIRYASLNVHNGIEPSRRDDLISLGYIFILCLKGKLPWQNIDSTSITKQEKYNIIKNTKENTSIIDLCSEIPYEFLSYMNYCYRLEFDEEPNYSYLRTLFLNLLTMLKLKKNTTKTDT